MFALILRFALTALLVSATADATWAQDPDTAELEALVETLEDDSRRAALIAQLEALIEARRATEDPLRADSPGAALLAAVSSRVAAAGHEIGAAAAAIEAIPGALAALRVRAAAPGVFADWARAAGQLLLAFAGAWLAHRLTARVLAPARAALAERPGDGRFAAGALYAAWAVLAFVPPAAFAAGGWVVMAAAGPPPAPRLIGLALIDAAALLLGVAVAARLVLAPTVGRWRLAPVSDETAAALLTEVRRVAAVVLFGAAFGEAALALGLPVGAHAAWLKLVGLAAVGLLVAVVLRYRRPVADAIRGAPHAGAAGQPGGLRARLADFWHLPAILYVLVACGAWATPGGGFPALARAAAAAALALAAIGLFQASRRTFGSGVRFGRAARARFPGLERRADRYAGGLRRTLGAGVLAIAVLLLVEIWIGGAFAWLASEPGRVLVGRAASIALILLAAAIAWELAGALTARLTPRGDDRQSRGARLHTLMPLARNAARVAIGAVTALTIMSELGIAIGPLLAGAGIAGIAIGFGAQSLIKDVITGIFILLEDSIAVGDVVDVGGHSGVVESMTVRAVRLRDLGGNVHIVPFGDVGSVLNMTRDFSYALIEAGVAYKENVDHVVAVLHAVGEAVRGDPDYRPDILEPLEVLGLDSFGDSSVNIRVRLKTRPRRQWRVRREFHRRMKQAFDDAGIEIPFPYRTLTFADPGAAEAMPAPARGGSGVRYGASGDDEGAGDP